MYTDRLLKGSNSIRTIDIKPENYSSDGRIHASLSTFLFGNVPDYEALSYAWGDGGHECQIMVNERPMHVKRNLHSALLRLRRKTETRRFWVDAICINQNDNEEKTQQVSQMRDIFARAELVIMWVGEEDAFTGFQFAMIERWANRRVRLPGSAQLVEHKYDVPMQVTEDQGENEDDQSDKGDSLNIAGLPDIVEAFLTRPYFTRSWIVQEVLVSRNAVIMCGSFLIYFGTLVQACYEMGAYSLYKNLRGLLFDTSNLSLWQRKLRAGPDYSTELDLLFLLTVERDKRASDPRDKVFAFLGIADQSCEAPIKADYSKRVEEVYTAVARQLINAGEPFEVLSAVQARRSKLSMPSWVPDWSQPWYGGGPLNSRWKEKCFCAAGSTKAVQVHCQDESVICLRGLRLDVIRRSASPRLSNRRTGDGSPFVNKESLRADIEILGLQDEIQYPFTKENYVDAYLRTITRDLSAFSSKLDNQSHMFDRPSFHAWNQAGRPGLDPPEAVWHEVSSDVVQTIQDTEFFISEKGYLGLGPKHIGPLDLVCIFLGASVPFILRPQKEGKYQLIGECYIHGVMSGEAMNGVNEVDLENFLII